MAMSEWSQDFAPDASGRSTLRLLLAAAVGLGLCGCSPEKRAIGPALPSSPPTGVADGRARLYAVNRYEMSEGGRMFRWLGCDACHTDPAQGYLDLNDKAWRRGGAVPDIYGAIAEGAPGMPAFAGRVPPQQIWQLAGYVHSLNGIKPQVRRRNANAQSGEPDGASWTGPLQ